MRYAGEEFLIEKEGWTKISGSFIAQGGERYITIGNFEGDSETDTLFVPGGGLLLPLAPDYWRFSAYFIDDVFVTLDTTYVGIKQAEQPKFNLYPNPSQQTLAIETEPTQNTTLQLLDVTGRQVLHQSLNTTKATVDIATLPTGVYVAVLLQDGLVVGRKKVVKE